MSDEPRDAEAQVHPLESDPAETAPVRPVPRITRWRVLMNEAGVVVLSVAGVITLMKGLDFVFELLPSAQARSAFIRREPGWLLLYAGSLFIAGFATMRLAARKQKELTQQKKRLRYQRWKHEQTGQRPLTSAH
jgi:hypothetical protein